MTDGMTARAGSVELPPYFGPWVPWDRRTWLPDWDARLLRERPEVVVTAAIEIRRGGEVLRLELDEHGAMTLPRGPTEVPMATITRLVEWLGSAPWAGGKR